MHLFTDNYLYYLIKQIIITWERKERNKTTKYLKNNKEEKKFRKASGLDILKGKK